MSWFKKWSKRWWNEPDSEPWTPPPVLRLVSRDRRTKYKVHLPDTAPNTSLPLEVLRTIVTDHVDAPGNSNVLFGTVSDSYQLRSPEGRIINITVVTPSSKEA